MLLVLSVHVWALLLSLNFLTFFILRNSLCLMM